MSPGGPVTPRSTYGRANWLFLRVLGLVYLFAFWSLGTQILGLIGGGGILPARQYLDSARAVLGKAACSRRSRG
jgi:hypothetical protein